MRISLKKIYMMIYAGELEVITKNDLRKKGNFILSGKIQKVESNISGNSATCAVYLKTEDKET